ncbi:MOSC domain-containing protein [Sphingomonas sp.]|uniref:MOSC domain-containing protein n=1 Tax=Sphingomonas sp. TaxID=28214 RepID=UPI001AFD860B|nr:MOSC domain-containing protein [Sphingomonas sp.]MBO9713803.1 MOSC domain-containing protein [Sphingomonas sp.]
MGRLAGIARHAERRGPIETLESVLVTPEAGVTGDRNGPKTKRQVSLIEANDWAAAMAEVGADLPWWMRRANLLVEDFDLPHGGDVRIRIGAEVVIELKTEIDPCERMDELVEGLRRALEPDWRGGAGGKVIAGGVITVGDEIRIET